MKKIKTTLYASFALCFLALGSCTNFEDNESGNMYNSVPENIISDPLFKKLDEVFYTSQLNAIKYADEDVNRNADLKIKADIKNKVYKTFEEYAKAKEKAGYEDFSVRMKNKLELAYYYSEILKKYPEIDKKEFAQFFVHNKKNKIKPEDITDIKFKKSYNEYYK